MREGFSDFLSKPILPEKLDKILLEYIPKDLLIVSENDLGSSKKENKKESREITFEVAEFDFEYALRILGSEELLMDTLKDFYNMLNTLPNKLDDLFDNISNEEGLKNYRIEVHALKSVAATVGAILLSKLARIIESAATNNEEDKVMILHSILIEEIEKHRERLGDIFEETTIESKELDVNTINMYLQMMKASLTNKE